MWRRVQEPTAAEFAERSQMLKEYCRKAKIPLTKRQARKFMAGRGAAFKAMRTEAREVNRKIETERIMKGKHR